jgi:hypothetical protein
MKNSMRVFEWVFAIAVGCGVSWVVVVYNQQQEQHNAQCKAAVKACIANTDIDHLKLCDMAGQNDTCDPKLYLPGGAFYKSHNPSKKQPAKRGGVQ